MVSVTMAAKDANMASSFRMDAEQETATAKRSLLNHDSVHKFIMDAKAAVLDASDKAEDATWSIRIKDTVITVDFFLMYPSETSQQDIEADKAKVASKGVLQAVKDSSSNLKDYGIEPSSFKVVDNSGSEVTTEPQDAAGSMLRSSVAGLFAALAVALAA